MSYCGCGYPYSYSSYQYSPYSYSSYQYSPYSYSSYQYSPYQYYGFPPYMGYQSYDYYPSYGLPLGYVYSLGSCAFGYPRGEHRVGNCLMICQ